MQTKITGKKVLIIDDDPDFLIQQVTALQAAGCETITAESMSEAREALGSENPDAMLVDLMLDENDAGFVLCHEAKKRFPNMPILLITGVASETGLEFQAATNEERSWIKADRLLAKPVRAEQVISELENLL